ncbi:MAG: RNA-binding protein [Porphyromonas sp.]|uniref:S4 domain-containing protein n=1 Tax=Porphyromonas sp. TaxID=1924944 RepID=UPI001A38DE2E|nr:S4 domain-containing protein [Porphyromonas sp.]MBL6452839.1 RNA-binding protein [Porphyromonas sp.]
MSLRINKLLSDAGIGSRREVEKYIVAGRVTLNGERAELTDIVVEDDIVTLDGEELPVNDILREALSMKHYLEAQQEDRDDREASRSYSARGGERSSRPAKGGPKRMRSDRYGDEATPARGHAKGGKPYRSKGGEAHGRRHEGRSKEYGKNDDRW